MKINYSIFILFFFVGIKCTGQTLIPYYHSGKYGYCDVEGKIKIEPKYDQVDFFSKDSLAIVISDNDNVLINKKGFELLRYSRDNEIQILPTYNQKENSKVWHLNQRRDTIKHLKWIKLNEEEYQLLNLKNKIKSPIYILSSNNNHLSFRRPTINSFVHGYYIGKVSENSYDILNTNGEVINHSQSKPSIWSSELISIKVDDKQCIYNPQNDSTFEYPYQSITKIIENKYVIVSTSEQNSNNFIRNLKSTKYGLINIKGQIILDTLYQSIDFHNGTYILNRNGNSYLSDLNNILVDSTEFKSIYPLNEELLLAKQHDNRIKILDLFGIPRFNGQTFDEFKFLKQENYYTSRNGRIVSIIDSTLTEEISLQSDAIYRDYERSDRYIVTVNGKTGMINSKKDVIIPIQYDRCSHRGNNFIILTNFDKKGIADSKGRIILEPNFEDIQIEIVNGEAIIRPKKNGLYASYNLDGTKLSEFNSRSSYLSGRTVNWHHHKNSYHFTDFNRSPLNVDSKNFFTGYTKVDSVFIAVLHSRDTINEVIVDGKLFREWGEEYDSVDKVNISNGLFVVSKNDRIGIVDTELNIISPFSKQKIIEINNEFYITEKEGKYFLFNIQGKQINKEGYDYVSDSAINGRRTVGNIIPDKYYEHITNPCIEGRQDTILKSQKEYGYINKFGEVIIPLEYSSTFRFFEDYTYLAKGYVDGEKECYLIDTIGNVVLKTKSDKLYPLNHTDNSGYYISEINGKHGLIDLEGNTIIPFEYSAIQGFYEEEIINVRDFDNVWHLISIDNKHIFTGNHYNDSDYEQCYGVGQNKIMYFPNGNSEIIDRNGKSYMKIKSQDVKFVNQEKLKLIEVRMDGHKYYINRETLAEYRNTSD